MNQGAEVLQLKGKYELENGGVLENPKIAFHKWGEYQPDHKKTIWVCHALTANSDVFEWWPGLFGYDAYFNPDKYFIICANIQGSPYGSTSPLDINPNTGTPYFSAFPRLTIRDLVKFHILLRKELGIQNIDLLIGGSIGGYQVLEWAYLEPGKIDKIAVLASSAVNSPWSAAFNETQRKTIERSPDWGQPIPEAGMEGMKTARGVALLSYRNYKLYQKTQQPLNSNFLFPDRAPSYQNYQGDKLAGRFNAWSYYFLTHAMDSHNMGRNRGGIQNALRSIRSQAVIVAYEDDLLFPNSEQELLASEIPGAVYKLINTDFGHDGFLLEVEKLRAILSDFLNGKNGLLTRKLLKFGGKALSNEIGLERSLEIVKTEFKKGPISLVVSARADTTAKLQQLTEMAARGEDYGQLLKEVIEYQLFKAPRELIQAEIDELKAGLRAIETLGWSEKTAVDKVLAQGELMSAKVIGSLLEKSGFDIALVDARHYIFLLKDGKLDEENSREAIERLMISLGEKTTPVITGFIASDHMGRTTNLGLNGSNYSASLIAAYSNASEIQNWTDVNGLFSANPKIVPEADAIPELSYSEANDLANFGAHILHSKTLQPLMKKEIPFRILNFLEPKAPGTLISGKKSKGSAKAVTVVEDIALVVIEGNGLLGKIGIDERIFSTLSKRGINVRLISQASSEREIGFVIEEGDGELAVEELKKEFGTDISAGDISSIDLNSDIAAVVIIGRHSQALARAVVGLNRHKIPVHLISHSIRGRHISLIVHRNNLDKAVRVVHEAVFLKPSPLNVFAIGKGEVGSEFIRQLLNGQKSGPGNRIRLIGVADSQRFACNKYGIGDNWREELANGQASRLRDIIRAIDQTGLHKVVIVDNTASEELAFEYITLVQSGYHLVSSNKKANAADYSYYNRLRNALELHKREYNYETNVGAALPIVQCIAQMRAAGAGIHQVNGVFSGSLSYIFNRFSVEEVRFSAVLKEAKKLGYTEPDPSQDLSGMDVARKVLILARELGLEVEISDVSIESLIPDSIRSGDLINDQRAADELDLHYARLKNGLKEGEVMRYIGEIQLEPLQLRTALVRVKASEPLGGLSGSHNLFQIFSRTFGTLPVVIQGPGAGGAITAMGVYSDVLKLEEKMRNTYS
ncbi:MAG: homoserine O-acetyltransferase [Saprospirales bacterium]|nr:MAG: homoserine O-acetyltransferase [Saprospirales bacterium]